MKNEDDGSTLRVAAATNDIHECGCSVEEMLAVPMEYIFRDMSIQSTTPTDTVSPGWSPATPRTLPHPNPHTPTTTHHHHHHHRAKPLLSRIEAQLFLQVNTLSYEMDALTMVSITALQQRVTCRDFGTSLQRVDHPYLRPLVSSLYTYQEQMPRDTIQQVSSLLKDRMIPEFQRVIQQLRQFSEQNWTLADTLDDGHPTMGGSGTGSTGYHHVLAQEKRKLSDLQEELCQRIEALLLQVSEHHEASPVDDEKEVSPQQQISMKDYCDQLFLPQSDFVAEHIETTVEDVTIHHATHHQMEKMTNRTKTINEHVNEEDDEVLEEAPDRSTTATPMSSPEESPTLMEATSKTRASVLRNATAPRTSPLLALTTATTTDATPSTTNPPSPQNPTTEPSSATRSTNTSRDVAPQRQLEKSFGSSPAAASPEENEKENEPSQSSSQRSSLSRSTPTTTVNTVKRPRLPPLESSPTSSSTAAVAGEPQRPTILTTRSDDNDDDEDEIMEEKECFRTQSAAEVLSSFATTVSRTAIEPNDM